MNNSNILFQEFTNQILLKDDREEVLSIAYLVFESLFGLSKTDVIAGRNIILSPEKEQKLNAMLARINCDEPIQYILGEAYFFERKFKVDQAVLIPRPETEDLITMVKQKGYLNSDNKNLKILDIGTGSGCIAITLALEFPGADIYASDISEPALKIASENSKALQANVTFAKHDILKDDIPYMDLDIVISNPPYIAFQEKDSMMKNVVDHEPHLALFVSDNDPLVFYKSIAAKAKKVLKRNGSLLVEINERYGNEVAQLFILHGYSNVITFKDLSGKDRIVKGDLS